MKSGLYVVQSYPKMKRCPRSRKVSGGEDGKMQADPSRQMQRVRPAGAQLPTSLTHTGDGPWRPAAPVPEVLRVLTGVSGTLAFYLSGSRHCPRVSSPLWPPRTAVYRAPPGRPSSRFTRFGSIWAPPGVPRCPLPKDPGRAEALQDWCLGCCKPHIFPRFF